MCAQGPLLSRGADGGLDCRTTAGHGVPVDAPKASYGGGATSRLQSSPLLSALGLA